MPGPESVTDSGHDTTSTLDTADTSVIQPSLTIGRLPQHKLYQNQVDTLPQVLPSHKFRYSVWHDLRQTCLTGDKLHAPRVRAGPEEKDKTFYKLEEEGLPIHHDRYGKTRQSYMNEMENWEQSTTVNLCYQELCHDYQWNNFFRILARCGSAEVINLSHNTIVSMGHINFPSCEYLNCNNNYIKSFKNLPNLPKVKSITAQKNAIQDERGLSRLARTPLEELDLKGNPLCFILNYRQIVFEALPNLKVLDGIPRLPSDNEREYPEVENSKCTIL